MQPPQPASASGRHEGVIWVDSAESTHMLLKSAQGAAEVPPGTMLLARCQTRGRGQRGNSWESEDYRNLTFSMAITPVWLRPACQFSLSEAMALAVADSLALYGIEAKVKWPNDIYVEHRKICGILIDHSIMGDSISRSILSAGINVNQTIFRSDAPNPVSMLCLLPEGTEPLPLEPMAARLRRMILSYVESTRTEEGRGALHARFMTRLYLNDGALHPFRDNITGETIQAAIQDVAPDGILTLRPTAGPARSYRFKEVTFILPPPQ